MKASKDHSISRRGALLFLASSAAIDCAGGGAGAGGGGATGGACTAPSKGGATPPCLAEAISVRVPGARRLAMGRTVLTKVDDRTAVLLSRDAAGFFARSAICTHACCVVSLCRDDGCAAVVPSPADCGSTSLADATSSSAVLCPCHGSSFRLSDGAPLNGPATTPLLAYAVTFDGDDALVDTGSPVDPKTRAG